MTLIEEAIERIHASLELSKALVWLAASIQSNEGEHTGVVEGLGSSTWEVISKTIDQARDLLQEATITPGESDEWAQDHLSMMRLSDGQLQCVTEAIAVLLDCDGGLHDVGMRLECAFHEEITR